MYLVEKHIISRSNEYYDEIDRLSFLSKNLFNMSLYNFRQHFFQTGEYLSLKDNFNKIKNIDKNDYEALPRKVSNQILIQVDKAFKSFFKALKSYKEDPSKFKAKPKITHYKDKVKGRNTLTYEKGAVSKKILRNNGLINPSKTNIFIPTKIKYEDLVNVRIVKKVNSYVIEIVYKFEEKELKLDNNKYAGCDLGLTNLMTITFNNGDKPIIISGGALKSINQFYNKELARLKSELETKNGLKTSKKIKQLTEKRNNKIKDYLHKASRMVVNQIKASESSKFVIGKNDGWKQDINIGKKNNQNFVQVPFNNLIFMLEYKLKLEGIELIKIGEAYTSVCSFFDSESIKKHKKYKGHRIKRGLFKTGKGLKINADVNGSYNILKKAIPNAFANGIEGLSVNPLKLNVS